MSVTVSTFGMFALAAGGGAGCRYAITESLRGRVEHWFATLLVNTAGAFALGWLVGSDPSDGIGTVVGAGFLGAFTTLSSFALDASDAKGVERLVIATSTIVACVGAAIAGHALGA